VVGDGCRWVGGDSAEGATSSPADFHFFYLGQKMASKIMRAGWGGVGPQRAFFEICLDTGPRAFP